MRLATQPLVKKHVRSYHSWFWWLAPKPFDWLASPLYIGVFIAFIAGQQTRGAGAWQTVFLSGSLLLLLSIDRLECWRYGEETPKRGAILLLATRMLLIETGAQIEGF